MEIHSVVEEYAIAGIVNDLKEGGIVEHKRALPELYIMAFPLLLPLAPPPLYSPLPSPSVSLVFWPVEHSEQRKKGKSGKIQSVT